MQLDNFCQPPSYLTTFRRSSLVTSTIMKVINSRYELLPRKYKKITQELGHAYYCYTSFFLIIIYTLTEGSLTDLWLWQCRKSSDVLQGISMKREQYGDFIGVKIPRLTVIFSFSYQLKKSKVRLLAQSGPGPCQSMWPRNLRVDLKN